MKPVFLAVLLLVAACAAPRPPEGPRRMAVPPYPDQNGFVWCVPYARYVSGVALQGDADEWWYKSGASYARGTEPRLGSVLVLRAGSRLPDGHVAVVTTLEDARHIQVSHANWGWDGKTRGKVYENMPAEDISAANDWSLVRFLHPEVGTFGRPYPAYGFIYP
ncbi:CHAP domain-containing protein [Pararhodospirillum oryzae]|uniref:CHAP domain-containing protein n=1 Tax=Pararhodospirillum oryzae TaxID=478448 RepID=A0A512HB96_9PROT|nr:CHAP domain-containing protein [Pararhodospirillum oryzae]GEO82660.1 CHAP domain-containing protein [Pararhodospirillum oryzae]